MNTRIIAAGIAAAAIVTGVAAPAAVATTKICEHHQEYRDATTSGIRPGNIYIPGCAVGDGGGAPVFPTPEPTTPTPPPPPPVAHKPPPAADTPADAADSTDGTGNTGGE